MKIFHLIMGCVLAYVYQLCWNRKHPGEVKNGQSQTQP